jgi:hypothetical protein
MESDGSGFTTLPRLILATNRRRGVDVPEDTLVGYFIPSIYE